MKKKIYLVTVKYGAGDDGGETLLIAALTRAGAARDARKRVTVTAELASQHTLIAMLKDGAEVIGDDSDDDA